MTGLLKFGSREGKERSLLALYILHSLSKSPKSGYDLIAEIKEKTGGLFVPSKGTLYPVLHQLEDEHLIEAIATVIATGKRSKTTFAVTGSGKGALKDFKEQGRERHKKMALYRNLILDILGGQKANAHGMLFDIHTELEKLPPGSNHDAMRVLEQCLTDLKNLNKD
jgi:DNA-binding PadR family transcriptional regulator